MLLGIDQGTTSTKAALMGLDGQLTHFSSLPHAQYYPKPGWIEQDATEIWKNTRNLIDSYDISTVSALALANPGETIVAWEKSGTPLYPAITWQDTRTMDWMEPLAADQTLATRIHHLTGLRLDPYFSASKIRWLLTEAEAVKKALRKQTLLIGTMDSWLIWNLTSGKHFVTDVSTAARTLLFNIHTLTWDSEMLELFQIPKDVLPKVCPSLHPMGSYRNVPILAGLVDQPAAMFGHAVLRPGEVKATYGTGCFVYMNLGHHPRKSENGLLTTIAWKKDGHTTYALDGGVLTVGSAVDWLKRIGLSEANELETDILSTRSQPEGSHLGSVLCIPSFCGLGAPFWQRNVKAAWLNMELSTSRQDLVKAVLDGIACRVVQVIRAMEKDSGLEITRLCVDGGLVSSRYLMQRQADFLGLNVEVSSEKQATLKGVCAMAALACEKWKSEENLVHTVRLSKIYRPQMGRFEREHALSRFDDAIRRLQ